MFASTRLNNFHLVAIVVVMIAVVSCSRSNQEETATPPVQTVAIESPTAVTPSVEPTRSAGTATPESTVPNPDSEVVDEPDHDLDLPVMAVANVRIDDCRISGELHESGLSGSGTAPGPTPSPVPKLSSRPDSLIRNELELYRRDLQSIVDSLEEYDRAFRDVWLFTSTEEEQAAQLHTFGNRLAQLCSALSEPAIPPEVFGNIVGLSESIRARHAWTLVAAEELVQRGDARVLAMGIGFENTSTAVDESTDKLDEFFTSNLVGVPGGEPREVLIDRFGMSISLPPNAVVVRNTIDFLATFVDRAEILNPDSLGPENWQSGTALRIRRLRNITELSVDEAVAEISGIVARYGEPRPTSAFDISGFNERQFSVTPVDQPWKLLISVFVDDGHTFIVEVMCAGEDPTECDFVSDVAESLALTG